MLWVTLLVLTFLHWRPTRAAAEQASPIGVAEAYIAAWNAHDPDAVLACLAPDAIVRQRGAELPENVWNAQDEWTVRDYLDTAAGWGKEVSWARGTVAVRTMLMAAFQTNPHVETFDYQAGGDTVTWRYRLRQDPFQQVSGVEPLEGTAEAIVHDGRITRLSMVHDRQSVARRTAALDAALVRSSAQFRAPVPAAASAADHPAASTPTGAALPLFLLALAAAGAGAERQRRR